MISILSAPIGRPLQRRHTQPTAFPLNVAPGFTGHKRKARGLIALRNTFSFLAILVGYGGVMLSMLNLGRGVNEMRAGDNLLTVDERTWQDKTPQEFLPPLDEEKAKQAFLNNPNLTFRYLSPVNTNNTLFTEASNPASFQPAKDIIAHHIVQLLKNRPDLFQMIQSKPYTITLYDAPRYGPIDPTSHSQRSGHYELDGGLQWSAHPIDGRYVSPYPVDIVVHEVTHKLDHMDAWGRLAINLPGEGLLPGWTPTEIHQYKAARIKALVALSKGQSPLANYAVTNDMEFLAVLVETYRLKPEPLRQAHPELYSLIDHYFQQQCPRRYPQQMLTETGILFRNGVLLLFTGIGTLALAPYGEDLLDERIRRMRKKPSTKP